MSPPLPFAGEMSATSSSLLWALSGILFVRIRPRPSALALNHGKNLTGTGCFLVLLLVLHGTPWPLGLTGVPFLLLAVSGVLGLTLCDSLLFRAFLEIGPRRANVFMTLSPAIVAGMALLPPLSEHPPITVWGGMALCLGGILLAVLERSPDPVRQSQLRRGARDALLAAFLQATGMVLAREAQLLSGVTVEEAVTVRLVFGTGGLVLLGLVTGRVGRWHRELAAPGVLAKVAFAAFLATFLGLLTNQAGLAWSTHAGVAATLNALAPVFLIPLSAMFLAERHDWRAWVSALLAVGGIALMVYGG